MLYQCVHGLGHGLMIYTQYDLPLSLKICDGLADRWDQSSCTGGIFMENLQSSLGIVSPWLKKGDPLYPCDIVASRDKLYCYLMVTSRILPVVHYDFRKAAAWCRRAESRWVATCFQSFGRDASGFSVQNPRKIVQDVEAGLLATEGERPHPAGLALQPPKQIFIVTATRAAGLASRRELAVRLSMELLAARNLVLTPFDR